ncbi:hypothetical protein HDIA_0806 [Hartmannibacter diazotrophicus]|uniref:Uncharacterized protein n=1 Tax=Hartmannibacter diazotrophicus TaxID=1482074 RepID=A0A2C9D1U1_9HYPH|nr:hypothetical protein HDIA_0806 [Hartmannibacter diazotrophicus]
MKIVSGRLYGALRSAGLSDEDSLAATEEVAGCMLGSRGRSSSCNQNLLALSRELKQLQWTLFLQLLLLLSILVLLP